MGSLFRKKWCLILAVLIILAVIIGLIFGPLVVKVFGTIIGIFVILAIVISGNGGGGGTNPWHYQSGNTGGGAAGGL